ncbi:hypothetical protein Taro_050869 [Colocasia esculenta]|uniref:Uncharacterized protein n=1 Tax=Colocasia esculenta TaxID=4460 RepID=A0A843XEI0_COLES|nr:hypothetical protein [Colocasia esculenta]
MERHKLIPQPFFPSYNRTPKHLGCLNTLQPNPRGEFTTCWGRVEELLVARELWIDHKKAIFFPHSSATTCANCPLGVELRTTLCQNRESLVRNPKHYPFSIGRRPKT